ncbi:MULTISPECIES: hypothetical protein [unclassified Bacillus (in: firmicutes)]|uniref:hypothetical protein n=1 Tax=unclassified Bacillus (in: firmicutes) TaxID=185979 RepID=UPI000D036121|nr:MULTISPECIES: hypothetical protein [unclassified Bacillus (in: firmicutes)]PRR92659.1 hypothetical protein C6W21_04470 [Bacillus sp. NMCN1]PRS00291.1 hypothetical protein C6W20_04510 [Bacillus sp. NMCN6]
MNKLLAILILGLSFSGAALILTVPFLFKSKVEHFELAFFVGSAVAFAVFAVSCLVLRKRFNR